MRPRSSCRAWDTGSTSALRSWCCRTCCNPAPDGAEIEAVRGVRSCGDEAGSLLGWIGMTPPDAARLTAAGEQAMRSGNAPLARSLFEQALALQPRHSRANECLAYLLG